MTVADRPTWVLAILFMATFGASQVARPVAAAKPPALDRIPMMLSGWTGMVAPPLDAETARILGADQYVHRYYSAPGVTPVEMDVAYYAQPRVGATAHSPLNCLPGNGWTMHDATVRNIETATGTRAVRQVIVARDDVRWAMLYWYQTPHRIDYDEFASRWHLFTDALRRRQADTAMVRVMAPLNGDERAREATIAFTRDLIPQLETLLVTRP